MSVEATLSTSIFVYVDGPGPVVLDATDLWNCSAKDDTQARNVQLQTVVVNHPTQLLSSS